MPASLPVGVLGTKEGRESEKGHPRVIFFVLAAQVGSDIFINKPQELEYQKSFLRTFNQMSSAITLVRFCQSDTYKRWK